LREEIDLMLLGETLTPDGVRYAYGEIIDWASARGLQISAGALSRHRNNHLAPALQAALETEQMVSAISAATGKKLSLHSAVINIIAAKIIRQLEDVDVSSVDTAKLLTIATKAAEVAGKLERTEQALTPKQAAEVSQKLESRGISTEVITEIEHILGMR
jgi:hypothetical protein